MSTELSEWTVQFTLDGAPPESDRIALERAFEEHGIDASVSAIPHHDQWVVSVGVFAHSPEGALHDARLYADKVQLLLDPVAAVEVLSLEELERRAYAPTMPTLVGASEVAAMLGVTRQRVHQLRGHPAFPEPLVEVAMGPLWDERAVEKFGRVWERKPGRRPMPR